MALFILLLGSSAYFFPRWADWNQNSRFDLVLALVDDRAVTIDGYVANTGDYAEYEGHFYSDKPPGLALLGVPAYTIVRPLVAAGAPQALRPTAAGALFSTTMRRDATSMTADKLAFFVGLTSATFLVVGVPSAALGLLLYVVAGWLGL